ncbi:MAG: hypothetical protein OXF41_19700 [bacterium]|nr:hypothetical protein [bacterium]
MAYATDCRLLAELGSDGLASARVIEHRGGVASFELWGRGTNPHSCPIREVFRVMYETPRHTYQIVTKRSQRLTALALRTGLAGPGAARVPAEAEPQRIGVAGRQSGGWA